MIKMIVVDLDGTILNDYKKVSMETKKYLKELKEKGYIITIATGRIFASVLNTTDNAEFANFIITDTGACVYDMKDENPIFKSLISKEIAQKIFNYYNDDVQFIEMCDKYAYHKYDELSKDSFILDNCKDIFHISFSMKNNDAVINLHKKLVNDFPELEILIMQDSFSDTKWIEIMRKGVSKYNAIKKLSNYLNIKNNDIIAFGDGLNDIEMLEKCGYGVALNNALPEVKEASNDITYEDYKHNGVIKYLKEILEGK